MAKCELDDMVTYYFIVDKDADRMGKREIRAYSDDKRLAEFYMEMHGRKSFIIRKVSQTMEQMVKILNQYPNDGISMANLITKKDGSGIKKNVHDMATTVAVPVTTAEAEHVKDMISSHCSSLVDYQELNNVLGLLKKKYLRALKALGLVDIVQREIYNAQDVPFADDILFDEVMLLIKFFPDSFD